MQKGSRDVKIHKKKTLLLTMSILQYNKPRSYISSENEVLGADGGVNNQFSLGAGKCKDFGQGMTLDLYLESLYLGFC